MKAAPFSKHAAGRKDIRLYVGGDPWDRARYWNETSDTIGGLLCPDEHPERYRWDVVRGADVTVLQVGPYQLESLQRLGELLVQAGAGKVATIYVAKDGISPCFFTGVPHGQAA